MNTNKSYEVKDWFADKVANEVRSNISMCDVFAVLKETEKAVYAVLSLGCDFHKTMWVPKSVLLEYEVGDDEEGKHHYRTFFTDNYDEAIKAFRKFWACFK